MVATTPIATTRSMGVVIALMGHGCDFVVVVVAAVAAAATTLATLGMGSHARACWGYCRLQLGGGGRNTAVQSVPCGCALRCECVRRGRGTDPAVHPRTSPMSQHVVY